MDNHFISWVWDMLQDLKKSTEEYMYVMVLRILGEFFISEDPPSDPNIILEEFRIHMCRLHQHQLVIFI